MISIIVAAAQNNAIGKNNELLWHMPADLKYFKDKTTGHAVIMGRKTYESVGKPLPNRRNIVITRKKDYQKEGIEVCHSLQDALALCDPDDENFIVGGAEVYSEAMAVSDRIYFTLIYDEFEADAFFPPILPDFWQLTSESLHEADDKNPYDYNFMVYERKKKF
ncbi:dihydrofolate reductase [Albibacterium indicum]|uniref:dihydrofolate reductase n=1 Tax=Albibacterium indicum TaxID=2292082 RepID=UPI000E49ECBB|nr:dihydrofolate reductase [Pedobacter indicus]